MIRFDKICPVFIFCSCMILSANCQDVTEQFFFTTVKIEASKDTIINNKKTKKQSIATGFFYEMLMGKDTLLTIVTNKHVVAGYDSATIRFNIDDGKTYGKTHVIKFSSFDKLWITHPTEDLAVLPILPVLIKIYNATGKPAKYKVFNDSLVLRDHKDTSLTALVDVLMIGYPKGFHDKLNNIPIIRRGMSATPVYLDYNNEKKFLIDIPIFDGCSGSPVVQYEPLGYSDNAGNVNIRKRLILLGVVAQQREYLLSTSNLIVDNKQKMQEIQIWSPFNIGVVIKAEKILDFKTFLLDKLSPDYTKIYNSSIN